MTVRPEEFPSLDALPEAAGGLFAASPDLFHSPAWWRTVLAYGMPERTRPCFLTLWDGATPVALFPLRRPDRGSALASLTTPYTCDYTPLLAPRLSAAAQADIFAGFARFCRGWATTRLDALPDDWPELPACMAAARQAGLAVVRFAHFGNWYEDVRGQDWHGYLAGRPGALRETIRRKLRRGERRSAAAFSIVTQPRDLEPGIAAFEQVYAKSWKDPEPFPLFNAALMRATAAEGLLRLGIWRIGDVPVAVQLWIVQQGRATVLKLAHDEAFQADSPGTVLTALMLRSLLDQEHVDAIDFGRGDDAYKQGWASQRRQRIGLVLVNPRRPAGLAFLARHRLGEARKAWQAALQARRRREAQHFEADRDLCRARARTDMMSAAMLPAAMLPAAMLPAAMQPVVMQPAAMLPAGTP
jgi:CelD/BcsL family acetyltransferase involved in cellulose biosynthesis